MSVLAQLERFVISAPIMNTLDPTRSARSIGALDRARAAALGPLLVAVLGLPVGLLCNAGCSKDKVVVGEQCPSPNDPRATVQRIPDAGAPIVYGTSCAPCEDAKPQLDARGCPIFVTFESCGGDICIHDTRITRIVPDAGDADGGDPLGNTEDAGVLP